MERWPGIIEYYRPLLSLPAGAEAITLLEGNTPLIPLPRLADAIGAAVLYAKCEGLNPTGSFKDRGMSTAVTEAAFRRAKALICASTGNTAASAAAYASRAGLRAFVLVPQGRIAPGKLAGAMAYGANVIEVQGSFDTALAMVRAIAEEIPIALVNSVNPYRLEGQKTAAFEVCDALGKAPDWVALPVGNAGNMTAYWMGFTQYHAEKQTGLPRLLGVQAAGAAPLVLGHPVDTPETVATAICIGRPVRGPDAQKAATESGGRIIAVSDEEILEAQSLLAEQGLWVEPASAASLAGLRQEVSEGRLDLHNGSVACICTGHGLKDSMAVIDRLPRPHVIPPDAQALREVIVL